MQPSWKKRAGVFALVVLGVGAVAQAIQPEFPAPAPTKGHAAWDTPPIHPRVAAALKRACADCHSNQTVWPWYAHISPTSWFIAGDVAKARKHLNFSVEYTLDDEEINEIYEAIDNNVMPPKGYLLLHPDATLTGADRTLLKKWWLGELTH